MNEVPSAFTSWSNFYVIVGSSAGALTGLMFVVLTLIAGERNAATETGVGAYGTPNVLHFGAALFICALMSAPWRSIVAPAAILTLSGLCAVGYILVYVLRMMILARHKGDYEPAADDWIWYATLPFASYAAVTASAVLLSIAIRQALFVLAGATLMLLFIGIRNAWDMVTYITLRRMRDENSTPGEDR